MKFDKAQELGLREYLLRELPSVSGADPSILSEYVITLLQHSRPLADLANLCREKLSSMLSLDALTPFVNALFVHLEAMMQGEGGSRVGGAPLSSSLGSSSSTSTSTPTTSTSMMTTDTMSEPFAQHYAAGRRSMTTENHTGGERLFTPNTSQHRSTTTTPIISSSVVTRSSSRYHEQVGPSLYHEEDDHMNDIQQQRQQQQQQHDGNHESTSSMAQSRDYNSELGFFKQDLSYRRSHGERDYERRRRGGPSDDLVSTRVTIERIPLEHCTEAAVLQYFAQFGAIERVLVTPEEQRALITFASSDAALAAFRSPEAIFGNRFVKIFLDRGHPGFFKSSSRRPSAGAGAGAGGAPYSHHRPPYASLRAERYNPVSNNSSKNYYQADYQPISRRPYYEGPSSDKPSSSVVDKQQRMLQLLDFQKKKEAFLQKQIQEQSSLLAQLESVALSDEARQMLMTALRAVQDSIQELSTASPSLLALGSSPLPPASLPVSSSSSSGDVVMAAAVEPGKSVMGVVQQPQLSYSGGFKRPTTPLMTDAVATATSTTTTAPPQSSVSYNLYGKTPPLTKSFRLDNSKKISITPIPDMFNQDQALFIKSFKLFGTIVTILPSDDRSCLILEYQNRNEAEMAVKLGPDLTSIHSSSFLVEHYQSSTSHASDAS